MSLDKQITIGMSGHIDHGKTSIVKAITGKDTDSLKQERERGMTIDLGFAYLNEKVTIIDVPGHEKFVKNMMSGASGIDMAILVIAADDGIMPQTIEHLEILKLLKIKYGFIILNKIDLADDDWITLVESDINDIIKGSFLDGCDILRVSATQNIGFDKVKEKIEDLYSTIPRKSSSGIFRMHIDRVFSKTGFGCVVTGTVGSGSISVGDIVELLPSGQKVKVRNIQSHGASVDIASEGERAAINLNNIEADKLKRGYHLSKIDTYSEINLFLCDISINNVNKNKIKNDQRVRIHLGTREVMARISTVNTDNDTNKSALIKLESPIVAGIGDRFIIRSYSPVYTIGGGIVVDIPRNKKWKELRKRMLDLHSLTKEERLYNIIRNISYMNPLDFSNVERRLNISNNEMHQIVKNDTRYTIVDYNSYNWILTNDGIANIKERIMDFLLSFHKNNPIEYGCNKKIISQGINIHENLLSCMLEQLKAGNKIKIESELWSLVSFKVKVNSNLNLKKDEISKYLKLNMFIDLKEKEILENFEMSLKEFHSLLNIMIMEKHVIKINSDVIMLNSELKNIKLSIVDFLAKNSSLSVPDFKRITSTTRKYAIPVLEYLDKIQFTFRSENSRKLVEN